METVTGQIDRQQDGAGLLAPETILMDRFGRRIEYLRISVTDRCNYRCVYCMPEEGVQLKPYRDILRFEQIETIVREAVALGITRARLTGGEPLVKCSIVHLVERLARIPGLRELAMTTNGSLLTRAMAAALKNAGLARVNISLDTLNPERFAAITRGGRLADVLSGIEAAREAGLLPIKINTVVTETTTREDLETMRGFCAAHGLTLQTIKQFALESQKDPEGPIEYDRPPRCATCNRLRLTADGYLKPCLFSGREIRVDMADIRSSLRAAVAEKPQAGQCCTNRRMNQIGG